MTPGRRPKRDGQGEVRPKRARGRFVMCVLTIGRSAGDEILGSLLNYQGLGGVWQICWMAAAADYVKQVKKDKRYQRDVY